MKNPHFTPIHMQTQIQAPLDPHQPWAKPYLQNRVYSECLSPMVNFVLAFRKFKVREDLKKTRRMIE